MASINFLKVVLSSYLFFALMGCSENYKDNEVEEEALSSLQDKKSKKIDTIPVHVKKKNFKELVIPAVEKVYSELDNQYKDVKALIDSNATDPKIDLLMKKYSAKDKQQLLKRLKPHPKSIAVAQAAMESAWATSRFTKVANNLFGVWSFSKSEPRIAASETRGDKTIYVKKYDSITKSVRDYYMVLSKGRAYKEFRELNMKTKNPYELVKKLHKYSEKGDEYGKELAAMIRFNKFYKLDGYKKGDFKNTGTANNIALNNTNTKQVNIKDLNATDTNNTN